MFLLRLLVHVAFVFASSASVIFEDCGSAYALQNVYIDGCNMKLPCYVTLGEEVPVSLEFYAGFTSSQLDQDVVININLINLSTPVTPEPCEIVDCPVKPNASTSFTSILSVPRQMALNQRGYLRWQINNESGQLVVCYSVLVQTQSPLQKKLRAFLAEVTPDDQLDEIINGIEQDSKLPGGNTNEYLQEFIDKYIRNQNTG